MNAPDTSPRHALRDAHTVVVKIGTAVLTGGNSSIDDAYLRELAAAIVAVRRAGRRVLIVSSGAIGVGNGVLGRRAGCADVSQLQAAAAVGQPILMTLWREAFAAHNIPVAQMLLTRADFDSRERYLNIRNCAAALEEWGKSSVVTIVNENDTVATEEISVGDNDILAANMAVAIRAEALVILTTVDGVERAGGEIITEAVNIAELRAHVREDRSGQGRGGMATKLEAARLASEAGIPTVIGPGRPASVVEDILAGEPIGTLLAGDDRGHRGKKRWIALAATPSGTIRVDDGAVSVLRTKKASLLAKGVTGCEGRFEIGDVVSVCDPGGREIARGLSNLTTEELKAVMGRASSEFEAILGRRAHEEVIHRDNLALSERNG